MPAPLDTRPLTAPISRAEVSAWRRSSGLGVFSTGSVQGIVVAAVAVVFVVVWAVVFLPDMARLAAGGGRPTTLLVGLLFPAVAVVAVGAQFVTLVGRWRRWALIDRFARANGLRFGAEQSPAGYPGAVFQTGDNRRLTEHVSGNRPRFLDIGNLEYTTGSGKNRTTHRWGFLALRLERRLPNMVLDSVANNGLFGGTNLPYTFARDQVLSLEGDFDRYFRLYCPRDYERDALYVFTPDLMALLIDEASPYDVEIVDDWMFVYSARPLDLLSPVTWDRMIRIVDTVGAKTLDQTERYADERMPDARAVNLVAPGGRRLRRGVPVFAIVVVVAVAGWWVLSSVLPVLNG